MDEAMAADSTQQSDHTRASDLGNRSSRIDVISMKDALLQVCEYLGTFHMSAIKM